MLKIAGSILVMGATTLFGMKRASELREQCRQMEYVRHLFYQLQSEIRYARSPLGEIFASIGKNAKDPYGIWLLRTGEEMSKRDGGTFYDLWRAGVRKYLGVSALSQTELNRLEELGGRLGLMDADMQVKAVELYLSGLSSSIEEIREGMKSRVRLCHCLGVMSGMLIVILLL
ncbi:MAG: stage III sporulation protein AB [Lachnospiraceae bacterium]